MNTVHFRPNDEVTEPPRRFDVGVFPQFEYSHPEGGPGRGVRTVAEQQVRDPADDQRVGEEIRRMRVERGRHFEPVGAVMDLVEQRPQAVVLMAETVPPVHEESHAEITEEALKIFRQIGQWIPFTQK